MTTGKIAVGAGAGATLGAIAMSIALPNIQTWEGTKLQTYRDVANVLTICTGHTGPDVMIGQVKTKEQCNELTLKDVEKAASGVLKTSPHLIFHPMQLAATISFSFNVGTGTYSNSSVARDLNSGNFISGCNDLLKYDKILCSSPQGCQVSQGLKNRREAEYKICMSTLTTEGYNSVQVTPVASK
jgi:lysozyme